MQALLLSHPLPRQNDYLKPCKNSYFSKFSLTILHYVQVYKITGKKLARIPELAVQKFFWEWPNISVGVVALKVFWDVATETITIKHMCWSDKAIIVFLNSGFKLLTSVLYARIIIARICACSNQPYPGIFNLFLMEKSMKADTGNKLNIKTTIKNIRGMLKRL